MSTILYRSIEEFCRTGSGGTPSRSKLTRYYEGGTIPWVKSGELRESEIFETAEHLTDAALQETSVKLVPKGAILLAMYGATVGRLALLGVEATTNQAVCHIVPDPDIADTRYLFHALSSQVPSIVAMGVGGAQPNISQGVVRNLKVPLPPLQEQRRISAILDKAETLRAKRREALVQLDRLAQSIFVEMFGEPATNPKQWPTVTIGDLLLSASYGTSEKSSASGKFPVLRMNNITRTGEIDLADLKYMDLEEPDYARYLVQAGDVLFNRTNSAELVGKTAIFREQSPMAYAGYLIRLRTSADNDPEYLAGFMNTPYAKRVLRSMCKSIIGMANINATEVQSIRIARPPLELQTQYRERIESVNVLKTSNRKALSELDNLFSSLQQRVFRADF